MSEKKIWCYLFHLCQSMWPSADPHSRMQLPRTPQQIHENCEVTKFTDKHKPLVYQMLEYLPSQGFNTVLIDVGNGVKFESHPEICMKEALEKDEVKKLCDDIRKLGMTPIPKLNFSNGHNAWLREVAMSQGTDYYFTATADLIREVAELFGWPEYFHLGLDEEDPAVLGAYGYRRLRSGPIWWRDAYRLFDVCEQVNARPWIWGDVYWHRPQEFKDRMPKSVLISNWFYGMDVQKDRNGRYEQKLVQAYIDLNELGYDQVPTGSGWECRQNYDFTFQLSKNELDPALFKGVMAAPWGYNEGTHQHVMMQDALSFGLAKKKYFPED